MSLLGIGGSSIIGLQDKADLESPEFTGAPKAPTPDANSDDTSIATTKFVNNKIASIVGGSDGSDPTTLVGISAAVFFKANTNNVSSEFDALINGAPTNLNTLKELADAVNSKTNTAYVDSQITALINGAPNELNTLKRISRCN
jgi:hypothetical protein